MDCAESFNESGKEALQFLRATSGFEEAFLPRMGKVACDDSFRAFAQSSSARAPWIRIQIEIH
jgi:hypothetical protein